MTAVLMGALTFCVGALQGSMGEYPNHELLVETGWLDEFLEDPDVKVLDTRSEEEYAHGHVSGALHLPVAATLDPDAPRTMLGSADAVSALLGSLGIDGSEHVVVYDRGRSVNAARVFWSLEVHGHPKVSVLNGGFAKWEAEDRIVSTSGAEVEPTTFEFEPIPGRCSTKEEILADIERGPGAAVALDVRSNAEVERGRIPNSVHVEWTKNFTDDEVPVFRNPVQLAELYRDAGVARDVRVHAY